MQLVEIFFFGIIAASITISLYLIATFLVAVYKQRTALDFVMADEADVETDTRPVFSLISSMPSLKRDLSLERRRRMQLATPEPDLVRVHQGRFAAVVLPLATETDTYEAIQCRLCLN